MLVTLWWEGEGPTKYWWQTWLSPDSSPNLPCGPPVLICVTQCVNQSNRDWSTDLCLFVYCKYRLGRSSLKQLWALLFSVRLLELAAVLREPWAQFVLTRMPGHHQEHLQTGKIAPASNNQTTRNKHNSVYSDFLSLPISSTDLGQLFHLFPTNF